MFWVGILAVSLLLYVLLDGFDLGVGILFGRTDDEARRHAMLSAVAPIWDGNETWLVVAGVVLWGAFSGRLCHAPLCVLFAAAADAGGPDPARRGVRISLQDRADAVDLGRRVCRRLRRRCLHARLDRRRPREGAANLQRRLYRRRIRLVQSLCGSVRHRTWSRGLAARCLLARQEM